MNIFMFYKKNKNLNFMLNLIDMKILIFLK